MPGHCPETDGYAVGTNRFPQHDGTSERNAEPDDDEPASEPFDKWPEDDRSGDHPDHQWTESDGRLRRRPAERRLQEQGADVGHATDCGKKANPSKILEVNPLLARREGSGSGSASRRWRTPDAELEHRGHE